MPTENAKPPIELPQATLDRLVQAALEARGEAYAPYSRFPVGAVLCCDDGTLVSGCNVENASYSLTLCAERVAAVTAVASGRRRWRAIAIASQGGVTPCGACRQLLVEFAPELLLVTVDADSGQRSHYRLPELLPEAFGLGAHRP